MSWSVSGGTAAAVVDRAAVSSIGIESDRDRADRVGDAAAATGLADRRGRSPRPLRDVAQVEGRTGAARSRAPAAGRARGRRSWRGGRCGAVRADGCAPAGLVVRLPVLRHEHGCLVAQPSRPGARRGAHARHRPAEREPRERVEVEPHRLGAHPGRTRLPRQGRPGRARVGVGGRVGTLEQRAETVGEARGSRQDEGAGRELHADRQAGRLCAVEVKVTR